MTFNIQETYDKSMAELQELVKQHNELEAQIRDFREQAEAQLKQMLDQKQQIFVAAKQKEAVVVELTPYVKKEEAQEVSTESEPAQEKADVPPVKEKKSRK